VSGEKCRHPPPGYGRYTYGCPIKKNLPNQKTHVFSKPTISSPTKQKQLNDHSCRALQSIEKKILL